MQIQMHIIFVLCCCHLLFCHYYPLCSYPHPSSVVVLLSSSFCFVVLFIFIIISAQIL